VAVSSEVLDWALKRSGHLADVQRQFPKLHEWQTGESEPTLRQVEDLARATSTPFGYFFLAKPPQDTLSIPDFRTVSDNRVHRASPDLLETLHTMERRQTWMREYLIKQGKEPLPFVGSSSLSDRLDKTAYSIRRALNLKKDWATSQPNWTAALAELRGCMEAQGILVFVNGIVGNNTHRKLDPSEFRGFVLVDDYAPLVFINGSDCKAAQMFTLAHELAHVWLGQSAMFDLHDLSPASDKTEQKCNQIAAELLLPADELNAMWPTVKSSADRFEAIARKFKVSQLVSARRALDLTLITKSEFLTFYKAYLESERKSAPKDGGDFYASQNLRVGKLFAETVVRAAREGSLLYRDAYSLTGLYGKTFEQYANKFWSGV
jgi:Zn-dependent peptidase ImmA (M78 family)